MIITSDAIAIHWVRYGDNGAVAHLFTRTHGYMPFMVRGLSSKRSSKRQLLQPLSLLEVDFRLNTQREVQTAHQLRRGESINQRHRSLMRILKLICNGIWIKFLHAHSFMSDTGIQSGQANQYMGPSCFVRT